jgi:hypothetical protein
MTDFIQVVKCAATDWSPVIQAAGVIPDRNWNHVHFRLFLTM